MKRAVCRVVLIFLLCMSVSALAAPVTFTPPQQDAVNKITGKGGLVMQLANDSDLLVVNLSLAGKQATDAELAQVKNLPKVAQLNLANTAVTDAGLAALSGMGELTMLHLEKTGVTDAGLANLKNLAKLEYLNLYATGITDAGLKNLSGLKNLKKLYLWQTKVTDGGVSELKKAIPSVVVNRGEELNIVVKAPDAPKPATPTPAPAAKPALAGGSATVALNSICPVSGKPVVLPNTVVYQGKLVAFCCDKCPKAFEKEPAKYAANIKFDIAPPAEKKPEAKPVESKPATAKPAEVKPAAKPVEPKPATAKPADVKPADQKVEAKPAAVVAVVNTKCPVSDHPIEAGFTAIVDGKTVGFCCDKCLAKFNKDPKKFADKIAADAK